MKSTAISFLCLSFLVGTCLLGCTSNGARMIIPPDEQTELDSVTENFFVEASARGLDISDWRTSVDVIFGILPEDRAGSCRPNTHPKVVTIDHYYWKIANQQSREQLVFHELAHCLMQREHASDTFKFGECKSWMRERDSDCLINLHNKTWRKYYLDELFAGQLTAPSWYRVSETLIDLKHYEKHFTISPGPEGRRLDSLLGNEKRDWILSMSSPPNDPEGKPAFFGVTVDDLAFEENNYNIDHHAISAATLMSRVPQKALFRRDHGQSAFKLAIQKRNGNAYLFLNDTLKYCLPLPDGQLSITHFGSPAGKYTIDVYIFPE